MDLVLPITINEVANASAVDALSVMTETLNKLLFAGYPVNGFNVCETLFPFMVLNFL